MDDEFVKNNRDADKLRKEGNKLLKEGKIYESLKKYNESLCNATPGSESMALSYANRSVIYFEMKQYDKCLDNICATLKNDYPEDKMEKINIRKEKCERELKTQMNDMVLLIKKPKETTKMEFKVNVPANPKIPFIANSLELRHNEKYGNFIITNKTLYAGDIIAVEDFFYASLATSCRAEVSKKDFTIFYEFCAHCFNSNMLSLYPCFGCTSTMYCSMECQLNSYSYHYYECEIYDHLVLSSTFCVRAFFQALVICNHDINELCDLVTDCINDNVPRSKKPTVFDLDYTHADVKKKSILAAYSGHCGAKVVNNKLGCIKAMLKRNPKTSEMMETHEDFIIGFIGRMDQVQKINGFAFIKPVSKKGVERTYAGEAQCLFLSLLNHSCTPNVFRFQNEKTAFVLIANQTIKAGEQIFDNYGFDYLHDTKEKRQKLLKAYDFECDCPACWMRFPLLEEVEVMNTETAILAKYQYSMIETLDASEKTLLPDFIKSLLTKCFNQLKEIYERGNKNMDIREDVIIIRETIYRLCISCLDIDVKFK